MRLQAKPQSISPVKTLANGIFTCPTVVVGLTSRTSISVNLPRFRYGQGIFGQQKLLVQSEQFVGISS